MLNKLMEDPHALPRLPVQEGMRRCGMSGNGGGSLRRATYIFVPQALQTSSMVSTHQKPPDYKGGQFLSFSVPSLSALAATISKTLTLKISITTLPPTSSSLFSQQKQVQSFSPVS